MADAPIWYPREIPIDFGQGVDTKTDPKLVVAGKLLRLENAVFTNNKRLTKRNGYTAFTNVIANSGTLSSPKLVHEYKNELIAADKNLLLSYSQSQDAWENRGNYTSTQLSRESVDQEHSNSGYNDVAVLGNYALYGWATAAQIDTAEPLVNALVFGSIVDLQTGTVLFKGQLSGSIANQSYNCVKCVVLGGTTLAIVYISPDYSQLKLRTVVFSGGGVVLFSGEVVVSTNYAGQRVPVSAPQFDIVGTASGATLAYFTSNAVNMTGMTITNLDTSGAITSTVNTVDPNAFGPIFISRNQFNNNLWVYWCNSNIGAVAPGTNKIVYAVFSSVLIPVLAKTDIVILVSPFYATNMISVDVSATQQAFYYGEYLATAPVAPPYTDATVAVTVTSLGVIGTPKFLGFGIAPLSRSFAIGPINYAVFVYRGAKIVFHNIGPSNHQLDTQEQPTYFVINVSFSDPGFGMVVARLGSGVANSQAVLQPIIGIIGNAPLLSFSEAIFSSAIETQEFNSDSFIVNERFPGGIVGVFSYRIDFSGVDSYKATNSGDLAILNGGLLSAYDGENCTEFGFHLFPEITKLLNISIVGGNMVAGTYSYIAIFQWYDAQGNQHQSAPSFPVAVTLAGADNAVVVSVASSYLSQKLGMSVAIFRTQSVGGTVYYEVTDPIYPSNIDRQVFITYTDTLVDADLVGNPQAYTYPGSLVLENSATPPAMILLAHNNRLWFIDCENPNTEWYTKSFQPGVGLSPSAFLTQQIDPKFGSITALAEMDEKIITFKQEGLAVQSGDGANDTGTNNTLSFPQFVPSDVGCSSLKSVVSTPNGVMFKSTNGIYLLNRSLGVSYLGLEVEAYNSQTITSAIFIPGKSQIRFLCSSGLTLVYDYIFSQWSTFTNHAGVSSTSWKKQYVYIKSDALIYSETQGFYLDGATPFAVLAETSWMDLSSVQGFQRVKRVAMLGDFTNGASAAHALQITASFNFVPSVTDLAVPFVFGAAAASGVLQYRERLVQQKCDTVSLLIQEIVTGNSSEYVDINNMSFEAAVKKGLRKMPQSVSVG